MEKKFYTKDKLSVLHSLTVPTLANAIETFGVIGGNEGLCNENLRCRYPNRPMMIGYAVTSRVATEHHWKQHSVDLHQYWDYVNDFCSAPKVAVCQDMDRPVFGAMWGEFNANVHRALGCVGLLVDGAVRDLDGIAKMDFHVFSTAVHPTHGNGAFIDYGGPVTVAGLRVNPGDLLVGDQHGVIVIPDDIQLDELVTVARRIDELESNVFACCQRDDFSLAELKQLDREVHAAWPNPRNVKTGAGLL